MFSTKSRVWGAISVTPLGCESLGTRSFSFFVETPDLKLLVDPSCALGPRRGFPVPHPLEYAAVRETNGRIISHARVCDHIFVSHYHQDHYKPFKKNYTYNYSDQEIASRIVAGGARVLLCKDHENFVNRNQARRATRFLLNIERVASNIEEVVPCDGRDLVVGKTQMQFSPPVPHGPPGTPLGYVTMLSVARGDASVVIAPDVQGPSAPGTTAWILSREPKPAVVFLGGPPVYLKETKYTPELNRRVQRELLKICEGIPEVIVGHHLARSWGGLEWLSRFTERLEGSGADTSYRGKLDLVAGAFGLKTLLLEASREELYRQAPPSNDFLNWSHLPKRDRARNPPPDVNPTNHGEILKSMNDKATHTKEQHSRTRWR
ncbi:MAG: MBL fold metallo-hydrolase [Promethearchaeota archaeon]